MPSNTDCMSGVNLSTDYERTICVKSYDFNFIFAKNPGCLQYAYTRNLGQRLRLQSINNIGYRIFEYAMFNRNCLTNKIGVKHRIHESLEYLSVIHIWHYI